jgi:PEGA domain
MKRFLLLVLSTLIALLLASGAAAEGQTDPATQRMRERFDRGLADYDAGRYDDALAEFQEAFAAKPLPAIRRNIALCDRQKALYHRAVDQLEAMLREEGDRLDSRVKEATLKAIQEMSAHTAIVRLGFRETTGAELRAPEITVTFEGEILSPERLAGPIRVLPGRPEFTATAPGYSLGTTPPGFVVQAGEDKPLVLELMPDPNNGFLRVRTATPGARASIDAKEVAIGSWNRVAIGMHSVRVVAQGYREHVETVAADGGRPRDVDVALEDAIPPVPPPPDFGQDRVEAPAAVAPENEPERRFFGLVALTLQGQTSSFASPLGPLNDEGLTGGGAAVKFGYKVHPYFFVDLAGEVGSSKVTVSTGANYDSDIVLTDWLLAPELRFQTHGKVRFVSSLGIGVEGTYVSGTLYQPIPGQPALPRGLSGSGSGWVVLGEVGAQLQLKRAFLEATLFVDAHDVRDVTDHGGQRMFEEATATRGGIRFSVGYPFF